MIPGRPYGSGVDGLRNEARRILKSVESGVSQIGSGRMAGDIVSGIKSAVAKAMDNAKSEINAATTELTIAIRDGSKEVAKAIAAEVIHVQQEFGTIVGNAQSAAEDAVDEAKKAADDVKTQG